MDRPIDQTAVLPFKLAGRTALAAAIVVASFAVPSLSTIAEAAQPASKTTIYRCDMKDGAVIYADQRCKGAAKIKRWKAKKVPIGITRTGVRPEPKSAREQLLMTMTRGTQDPFVDCKQKGGAYRVSQKLCILPPKESPNVIKRIK